jgi:hypothetical protein
LLKKNLRDNRPPNYHSTDTYHIINAPKKDTLNKDREAKQPPGYLDDFYGKRNFLLNQVW